VDNYVGKSKEGDPAFHRGKYTPIS